MHLFAATPEEQNANQERINSGEDLSEFNHAYDQYDKPRLVLRGGGPRRLRDRPAQILDRGVRAGLLDRLGLDKFGHHVSSDIRAVSDVDRPPRVVVGIGRLAVDDQLLAIDQYRDLTAIHARRVAEVDIGRVT